MKVKFLSDALVTTEVGQEQLFAAGDVQDLNACSAERWIRRGVAEEVAAQVTKTAKKKSKRATKPA